MFPLIAVILVLLAAGSLSAAFVPKDFSRVIGCLFSGAALIVVLAILLLSLSTGSINASESFSYIPSLSVSLGFSLSPITLALVLMASVVAFVTVLSGNPEKANERTATSLILLFEFAAIGLFASANLFLFFIFWDVGVVALFFMIYLLGSANRKKAATKFLIYEILASLLLLFAIMLVYFYTPLHSFDIAYIQANASAVPQNLQMLIFLSLFAAFLINMPVFPVHLWLPDAHTEASTQGSMLLSGILTKFGGYGMLIAFLMFPISASFSSWIWILAGVSAFYATFVLMRQHDIKRIIAYTTIVEMSIILIGIASSNQLGTTGAVYAMLAHGFAISLLFLAAGSISYIFKERDFRLLRGIVGGSLSTGYTMLVGIFATTGVPLTAAFIGDILIFMGAAQSFTIYGTIPLFALVILGAYLYYVTSKSILSANGAAEPSEYIGISQKAGYAILIGAIFIFGMLPFLILNFFNA